MIHVCPHCGHDLMRALNDGLTHCFHCNQVFDSSDYNKLLSAAWQVRKEHLSLEKLKHIVKLSDDEAILVSTFVGDYGYSHDDFIRLLRKFGVSHKAYIDYSA
jgi:hypothetical protein